MSTMHDETKTIICKNCGCENSIQSKFCDKCGAKTLLCIAEEKAAEAERIAHEGAGAERIKERKERCRAFFKNKFVFLAIALLIFGVTVCEIAKADEAKADDEFSIAGIDMVRIPIPDSVEHKCLYFGKYEVTQAQWQAIMGNNPSKFTGDSSLPVENVSWNDCQKFIEKLNAREEVKKAGLTFFLPTKAEWVYACRAGSTGEYGLLANWREGSLDEMGWYKDNSGGKTHPVGQKKPNAWGLYDMHGNVWEWTASPYDSSRIGCGGGCYDDAYVCGSSGRRYSDPDNRYDSLGFRLAASRTGIETKTSVKEIIETMVKIPGKDYLMGKYEVTQAQWKAIMGDIPSYITGDSSLPVEKVSWNECQEFIEKLNACAEVKQAGITFRLPTEEEWEYACCAGSTGDYGLLAGGREGSLDEMGWYSRNSGEEAHPVGQKKPNAWGLYDMHGNVWEWTTSAIGFDRIYRGGSYYNDASRCESRYRYWMLPKDSFYGLGFRLAASRTEK